MTTADRPPVSGEPTPIEIAATALHRWKHPTYDLGEYRCRCREDAEMAVRLITEQNHV